MDDVRDTDLLLAVLLCDRLLATAEAERLARLLPREPRPAPPLAADREPRRVAA